MMSRLGAVLGTVVVAFEISLAGCDTTSMEPAATADAVADTVPDGDVLVNPTCNALNLEGAPKAGIGGYGSSVPAGTGGPIADGTYVLVEGYISNVGEAYVEERRKIVVSAGRIEMIREQSDKTISTSVQTFTTTGASITLTPVCPTAPTSVTHDYTSEPGDAGRRRLVINEPFIGTWLTAFVYEQQ